jgi:ADP-ribose pyrophosphatase YjhB (NUDIX family)
MPGRIDYYHDPDAPPANSIVVAVTAFILDESGQLLMIRRTDNDLYAIPGGAQEVGETISQTVVREISEETGILVEVTGLIGVYSDLSTSSRSPTVRYGKSSPSVFAPDPSGANYARAARAKKSCGWSRPGSTT